MRRRSGAIRGSVGTTCPSWSRRGVGICRRTVSCTQRRVRGRPGRPVVALRFGQAPRDPRIGWPSPRRRPFPEAQSCLGSRQMGRSADGLRKTAARAPDAARAKARRLDERQLHLGRRRSPGRRTPERRSTLRPCRAPAPPARSGSAPRPCATDRRPNGTRRIRSSPRRSPAGAGPATWPTLPAGRPAAAGSRPGSRSGAARTRRRWRGSPLRNSSRPWRNAPRSARPAG